MPDLTKKQRQTLQTLYDVRHATLGGWTDEVPGSAALVKKGLADLLMQSNHDARKLYRISISGKRLIEGKRK